MTCSVQHDGIQQFSFNCNNNTNVNLQDLRCDNNTMNATLIVIYEGVSTLNVLCTGGGGDLIVFNKTKSISVTPSQVDIFYSTYKNNSYTIHFGQFENVEAISTVIIEEIDVNRNVIQQDVLLNVTFDRMNQRCLLDYRFKDDGKYAIAVTFQNGHYFTVIKKDLILAKLGVESTKKLNLSPGSPKFDALYSLSFQAVFEKLHVDYKYYWRILEDLEITTTDKILKKLPPVDNCYDFNLNVSNDNSIMAMASISNICTEVGVNVSLDYIKGIMLSDLTTYILNVDKMGPDSCLMLEINGTNTINIFQKQLDPNTCNSSSRLPTNKNVLTHNLVSQSDGSFVGNIDHLFMQEGKYEIVLIAENSVTSQIESYTVDVISIKCRSPEIEIIGKIIARFFFI